MKNIIKRTVLFLLIIFSFVSFTACEKTDTNNYIDLSTYLSDKANVNYFSENKPTILKTSNFISEEIYSLADYKYTTFKTNKEWTYGLTIESIEFEIFSNIGCTIDFTLTITNLKNAQYNTTLGINVLTQQFELSAIKDTAVKKTLIINDMFLNADAEISLLVDSSTFVRNKSLKYCIKNLKISGYHTQPQY